MKKKYKNLFHQSNMLRHLKFGTILWYIQVKGFFHKILQ